MKNLRSWLLVFSVVIILLACIHVWQTFFPKVAVSTTTSTTIALGEKTFNLDEIQSIFDNQSSESCMQVNSPLQGHVKDLCFFNLAFEKVNETYCNNIADTQFKSYCATTVAKRIERLRKIGRIN